jgi:integrase
MPFARDRTLDDNELLEVWRACREDDFGRIVRLLILTGQRREEVSGMAWSELDLRNAVWSLPGARTKNRRPCDVPLSDAALAIIETIAVREDRDLVFGEGEGSFSGWSNAKAALDKRILDARRKANGKKAKPLPAWRLHDLRRTFATGVPAAPHVVEAILNHVSGTKAGIAGVYNRNLYAADKRAALTLWGEKVMALTSAIDLPRVVPFRQATG